MFELCPPAMEFDVQDVDSALALLSLLLLRLSIGMSH